MDRDKKQGRSVQFNTKRLVLLALMLSLAVVLSIIESNIPIPIPIPGVRLGLANIIIMFALFHLKLSDALTLAVLKSAFVMLTRGPMAGTLSLTGGLFALAAMTLIISLPKNSGTYLLTGVAGAVFHNIGQIIAASLIMRTFLWPYLPVLLVAGILTGIATSVLLKMTYPAFMRLRLK